MSHQFIGLAPYFDNTVPSISVTVSEAVGNTVHTLTVADDDVDDINNLTISMATNTYFDISGSGMSYYSLNIMILIVCNRFKSKEEIFFSFFKVNFRRYFWG